MKLVLTDKTTQQEVVIDSDQVILFEPEMDSASPPAPTGKTHLVFVNGSGRIVEESPASIAAAVGTFNIQVSKAASVSEVSKGIKKK
jgi:hypothetical protein